jgi:hypothetical protein
MTKRRIRRDGGVLSLLNMLTYAMYAALFRRPAALPSNLIRRFVKQRPMPLLSFLFCHPQ